MDEPSSTRDAERRSSVRKGRRLLAGVPVRVDDIEPARGLHSIAILFRLLACLLGVIIVLQILNGVTSPVDISYGALIAEVIRLVIFAGLLWGAGSMADLFVTTHHDVRCIRITLTRLLHQTEAPAAESRVDPGDRDRGPGGITH
jgi:hypothetical protein